MSKATPIVPGRPGVGGGAPIVPIYPPGAGIVGPPLSISVADAVVVGESTILQLSIRITIAEPVTLTDSPLLIVTPLKLSTSDATTVSESTALLLITPGTVNRIDTVSVTDNPTLYITTLMIAAADSTTVSESITFGLVSPIALSLTESIQLTDSPMLAIQAPDIPPGPVITTERGAILCFCAKAIEVTTVAAFPFAATIIPRCLLAEVDVNVEIVIANLSANCLGPTFNTPLPPIIGAPGILEIRIDETITATESATTQFVVIPTTCMDVNPATPQDADDFDRADGIGFSSANWQEFTNANGGPTLGVPAFYVHSNQLQVFQDNEVPGPHDVVEGGWRVADDVALTTQFSELIYSGTEVLVDPGTHVSQPMTLMMGGPCVRMNQSGAGSVWPTNVHCYQLTVQEYRDRTTPYAITQHVLEISHVTPGITSLTQIALTGANILVAGDVVRLTAMNFATSGTTIDRVCLRAYVNGVQKLTTTRVLASATGIEAGRTGAGLGATSGSSDAAIPGFWKGYWSTWTGGAGSF